MQDSLHDCFFNFKNTFPAQKQHVLLSYLFIYLNIAYVTLTITFFVRHYMFKLYFFSILLLAVGLVVFICIYSVIMSVCYFCFVRSTCPYQRNTAHSHTLTQKRLRNCGLPVAQVRAVYIWKVKWVQFPKSAHINGGQNGGEETPAENQRKHQH